MGSKKKEGTDHIAIDQDCETVKRDTNKKRQGDRSHDKVRMGRREGGIERR